MNKMTKGAFAASAAVALLIGGGSTLAFWNAEANLGQASISSGNLALTQTNAGTWTIQHVDGSVVPAGNLADLRIVPGDKLVYTGSYDVVAQGKNLAFKASVTNGSITPATSAQADVTLASRLVKTASYSINGQNATTTPVTVQHKSNDSNTYPVTISVTLDWAFGTAGNAAPFDNNAKLGKVDLSNFTVGVEQVIAAA